MSDKMETKAIAIRQEHPLNAADLRAQVNLVQEVMKAVMKDGTHYGVIPGTPKPSLWKPGAEVLSTTFRIAVSYQTEDLSGVDVVRYRVTATGTHQTTGIVMGAGMGECSTGEEKYKWRKASNRKEFDSMPENRRRTKYGYDKYKKQEYEILQVRTEPADLANTVLKMACKRAQVAMVLNVTAASDIFTQDIEDLPEELRPDETSQNTPPTKQELPPCPQAKLDKWIETVQSGKQTAGALMAFASARHTLSAGQIAQIEALKKPPEKVAEDDPFLADYATGELNP